MVDNFSYDYQDSELVFLFFLVDFNISKLLTGDLEAIKPDYNKFKGGLDVIATTAGSILSCNIVTPIIRNNIAANRQRQALDTNKNQLDNYQKGFARYNITIG